MDGRAPGVGRCPGVAGRCAAGRSAGALGGAWNAGPEAAAGAGAAGADGAGAAAGAGADGAGAPLGAPADGAGRVGAGAGAGVAAGRGDGAGPGRAPLGTRGPGFAAGPGREALAPPSVGNLSFSRRMTGGSTVELAERTNSPISLSVASTTLLSTPNSLASS